MPMRILGLTLLLMLEACGQTGPLYLPKEAASTSPATTPPAEPGVSP